MDLSIDSADEKLRSALDALKDVSHIPQEMLRDLDISYQSLLELRVQLDEELVKPVRRRNISLTSAIYEVSTNLISHIYAIINEYSKPYAVNNPGATKLIRVSYFIWGVTEQASQEYALIGGVIASGRPPTEEDRRRMEFLKGQIEFGWQVAKRAVQTSPMPVDVEPFLEEAQTHYFMTYEQIKDYFYEAPGSNFFSPLPVETWLILASQAVDSLYELNDAVLENSQVYSQNIQHEAQRDIVLSLVYFVVTLLLSFYCVYLINTRIITPVNKLSHALYKAAREEEYEMPQVYSQADEIGKLIGALEGVQDTLHELAEERDKAKAAEKAKSEFLANMSHEIRTPMNVVFGIGNLLSADPDLKPKQQKLVDTLQISAEALLALMNDLLDFAKLETSSITMESVSFDLEEVVRKVEALMQIKADTKSLSFTTSVKDIRGQTYLGDPTRLKQVITNLCDNAIKFTSDGGVTLNVRKGEGGGPTHDHVVIEVTDTGIGIAPEQQSLVFEKFTQADSSITRKFGGTGLGLSISKGFVEKMGGTIKLESEAGKGTKFTILLPLPHAGEAQPQGDDPQRKDAPRAKIRPGGKKHVLLVEDYTANSLVAGSYLELFGYTYDIAVNGAEAVKKVKSKAYSTVLMDIQMPVMNGFEATKAIREYEQEEGLAHIKIIGMTAHALDDDRKQCLDAGMDDYIPKPIDPEDLRRSLA